MYCTPQLITCFISMFTLIWGGCKLCIKIQHTIIFNYVCCETLVNSCWSGEWHNYFLQRWSNNHHIHILTMWVTTFYLKGTLPHVGTAYLMWYRYISVTIECTSAVFAHFYWALSSLAQWNRNTGKILNYLVPVVNQQGIFWLLCFFLSCQPYYRLSQGMVTIWLVDTHLDSILFIHMEYLLYPGNEGC
jgi:hypothetical protein